MLFSFKIDTYGHYINLGNRLSKAFLIKQNFSNKKTILFVNDNKIVTEYKNLLLFVGVKYVVVDNYSSLVNLLNIKSGLFIVNKNLLETNLETIYNIENKLSYKILAGDTLGIDNIIKNINDFGYKFSEYKDNGTYRKIGDILHIYPFFTEEFFYRLSFFGDELDQLEIIYFNNNIQVDNIVLGKNQEIFFENTKDINIELLESFSSNKSNNFIFDGLDFYKYKEVLKKHLTNYFFFDGIKNKINKNIDLQIHELYIDDLASLTNYLKNNLYKNKYIITKKTTTIENFLNYNNIVGVKVLESRIKNLGSFYVGEEALVITDDNLDRVFIKKRVKRSFSKDLDLLLHIKVGDFITHIDHGISIFKGVVKKDLNINSKIISKEYLELEYSAGDKLFVPITEVKRVSKYIGKENPKLTGLNTKEWSKKLKKVSEEVDDIAEDLLEIFAKRKLKKGYSFVPDTKKIDTFQAGFPFAYTDDQVEAIGEIIENMESVHPMDRLLNGDVGFGKTEVCFNAIYNSFINKKQSILLTPLVVLAYEHYEKALSRFRDYGMNIGVLTRFESTKSISITLDNLKKGKIDLVIGTHKLLSKDVIFKDLGLVVIDEEHKFGVKDKEKIKELKGQVDILSLSATPIPRSLNMALNGLRQVSILKTPPYGRKPIETYVSRFSDEVIIDACRTEFERGGQVFFINNRVSNIENFKTYLQNLLPHKSIVITHGQLHGDELEKRIIGFRRKEYDILLSTTVIENGVDFPNVNTIFINDSYKFGISQIHQLRGRVGRSTRQGYCYLLFRNDNISAEAEKRLKVIVDYSHLGAGFELAMRDLEIRGGGEILGKKQSGQSSEVGVSIFIEMLENKIEELKRIADYSSGNTKVKKVKNIKKINTTIDLNISAYVEDSFFSSDLDKLNFYRELETVNMTEDLEIIINEFKQINGKLPEETNNLFKLLKLKFKASEFNIKQIKRVGLNYQFEFESSKEEELEVLKKFLDLDKEIMFTVIDTKKLRTPVKSYKSDLDLINYIYNLLSKKILKNKIRLKRKI